MSSYITLRHKGGFSKTIGYLNRLLKKDYLNVLDKYGQRGVEALKNATPKDTGLTASSWSYEIRHEPGSKNTTKTSLVFTNSNVNRGVNIAIILQYGHGTINGGYVAGVDYINPALRPIFDELLDVVWKEVTDK